MNDVCCSLASRLYVQFISSHFIQLMFRNQVTYKKHKVTKRKYTFLCVLSTALWLAQSISSIFLSTPESSLDRDCLSEQKLPLAHHRTSINEGRNTDWPVNRDLLFFLLKSADTVQISQGPKILQLVSSEAAHHPIQREDFSNFQLRTMATEVELLILKAELEKTW